MRFQDFPEIKVILKQTPLNQTVKFECTNGDFNDYKVDLTVGNRLFHGYFRTTEVTVKLPKVLYNKTTMPSPLNDDEDEDETF